MMFELPPRLRHSRQNRHVFFNVRVDLACPVCGHDVAFEPRAIAVICGQCRSPLHRQPDDDTPIAPTAALPFRVPDTEVRAKVAAAAGETGPPAHDASPLPEVRRMYVPYWRFAAHVVASWKLSEYDRVHERYDGVGGGFTGDYDEALPAAAFDGEIGALADYRPQHLAEATAFDLSHLNGIAALPPTVAVANAWSDMRERWESRIQSVMGRDRGESVFAPSEITDSSSEFSQERGALVYVPVYVADRDGGARPVVIDGYSGDVIRARRRPSAAELEAEAEAESVQVPDAMVGVGVLIVIAIVVLALGLWLARHLWWY